MNSKPLVESQSSVSNDYPMTYLFLLNTKQLNWKFISIKASHAVWAHRGSGDGHLLSPWLST